MKLAATSVNQRTDHVINNVQDPNPAPTLHPKQVMSYKGTGFGGKVQDASSYTLSLGATAIAHDVFGGPKLQTTGTNSSGGCLTRPPASQVVSELGNSDNSNAFIRSGSCVTNTQCSGNPTNLSWKTSGVSLNMGYMRQQTVGGVVDNFGVCNSQFHPLTESQFVDTRPDIKTKKMGVLPVGSRTDGNGINTNAGAQGTIAFSSGAVNTTTNTSGNVKNADGSVIHPANQPYNPYSARPYNPAKAAFVTSPTGPQVGGGDYPGSRAPKTGGATPLAKRMITHRGWANPTRQPYPHPRVPPSGSPAQLKINDATHYKF